MKCKFILLLIFAFTLVFANFSAKQGSTSEIAEISIDLNLYKTLDDNGPEAELEELFVPIAFNFSIIPSEKTLNLYHFDNNILTLSNSSINQIYLAHAPPSIS